MVLHQRPVQVQIDPAHQAVTAAYHVLFAGAPRATQLPVQAVRVDRVQLIECQHDYLRMLRWPMLGNLRAVVGDPAHVGRSATPAVIAPQVPPLSRAVMLM